MGTVKITPGRTVMYRLSEADVDQIEKKRAEHPRNYANPHVEGQDVPMIVVRVWPEEFGPGADGVNGQLIIDGNFTSWVTSVREGPGVGQWHWPERV